MPIFTLIGTAIAGLLFTAGTTAFGIASSLIAGGLAFAARLAFSYINRPKKRAYSAVQGQFQYGADVWVGAMFGTGLVAGHPIFYARWGEGDKYNADVVLLSNGWCDGLEPEIWFYGEKQTLYDMAPVGDEIEHWGVEGYEGLFSIRFYDGRPGQAADAKLVTDTAALGKMWRSTDRCSGYAYVVFERLYAEGRFADGDPEPRFVLRGLRQYDPTKDDTVAGGSGDHRADDPSTWEFNPGNPALHRLNYQLGIKAPLSGRTLIGEGKTPGQLDLDSYFAAIAACDADRGGKPTYSCAVYVEGGDDHTEILKEFEDAMAGYGLNRRGLSGVIAGAPQIPVMEIAADDIDAGRGSTIQWRKSSYEIFNHLSGQFTSPEKGWKPESLTPVHVNADVTADGGRIRSQANDFLQVTDADTAQYLLNIRYRQNRLGGRAQIPVSRRAGFQIMEGNWVTYQGTDWLVSDWECDGQLRVKLTLAQTDADLYDDADIDPGPVIVPSPPPINPSLASTVAAFAVEVGTIAGAAGYEQPALRFTWTPPDDPTITEVRFTYRIHDGDGQLYRDRTTDPEAGEYVTSKDVQSLKQYDAKATITTVPDRFKTETAWITTADPTTGFHYPVDPGDIGLGPILIDYGASIRSVWEELQRIGQIAVEQDAANYADKQEVRTEIRSEAAVAKAGYTEAITVATDQLDGDIAALSSRVETLEVEATDLAGDIDANATAIDLLDVRVTTAEGTITSQGTAITSLNASLSSVLDDTSDNFDMIVVNASAISALDVRVTTAEGTITSQATAITGIQSDLTDAEGDIAANATAISSLTTTVTSQGGDITANATAILGLESSVGDISADGLIRIETVATSSGALATVGISAVATSGATTGTAAILLDAMSGGDSQALLVANRVGVIDTDGNIAAIFEDGTSYFDNGRFRNLTSDNIDVAVLLASTAFIENLTVGTSNIETGAVSNITVFPGDTAVNVTNSETTVVTLAVTGIAGKRRDIAFSASLGGSMSSPEYIPVTIRLKRSGVTIRTVETAMVSAQVGLGGGSGEDPIYAAEQTLILNHVDDGGTASDTYTVTVQTASLETTSLSTPATYRYMRIIELRDS